MNPVCQVFKTGSAQWKYHLFKWSKISRFYNSEWINVLIDAWLFFNNLRSFWCIRLLCGLLFYFPLNFAYTW